MCLKRLCMITVAISCLLLPVSASAAASAATSATTYTITEAEMEALDSRLSLLLEQTRATRQALTESQAALNESKAELTKLKAESVKLKLELEAQNSLLASANKSLQESAREETRTRRRIKAQRNTAIGIAATAVTALVYALKK